MPTIEIDTLAANNAVTAPVNLPPFIRLPEGLVLIEIQGTINKPSLVPKDYDYTDTDFIKIDQEEKENTLAVRIGRLRYNENDPKDDKIELLIGTTQKLIGKIKKLDKPIGIMKFPGDDGNGNNLNDQRYLNHHKVKLVDIVRYKLVFINRPVPLMD